MSDKIKGNSLLLLTAVVWGSGFIAQKLGNNVMPPMSFNAIRQIMAGIVLTPIMMVNLKKTQYMSSERNSIEQLSFKRAKLAKAGVIVGFFLMGGTMMQQVGMMTVSAGKSGFISALYIVFTPLIAILFGSKARLKTFVCIAIAIGGFALLSLKGGIGGATTGDWLTLASAVCFACQIVAINCFVDKENDLIISVLQMYFAGIVGLIIALVFENPTWAQIGEAMPILLYATVFPTAIGYTLQVVGQKYTDATTAALLMSLEAVFAAIFGGLFLGEVMTARELIGCAIIFAATIIDQVDIKLDRKNDNV